MKHKIPKAFNDGKLDIYTVKNRKLQNHIGTFNFCDETIGIKQFYEFNTLGVQIEKIVSIPFNNLVTNGYAVVIDEEFYNIELIQVKDTFPKSLRITLTKTPLGFKDD